MSRVAKNPVILPKGVELKVTNAGLVNVKGPLGSVSRQFDDSVTLKIENETVSFVANEGHDRGAVMSGTVRSIVASMVEGVSKGFEKKLTLVGVGYRAQVQGNKINLSLGFSHPVVYELPSDVKAEMPSQTEILLKGSDKQKVGQIAAEIRSYRPPEPYKGKGVRYSDEVVVIKETKKK